MITYGECKLIEEHQLAWLYFGPSVSKHSLPSFITVTMVTIVM